MSLLIIAFLTLYFESPGTTGGGRDGELNRPRRAKGYQKYKGGDQCLSRYGGVELSYTMGSKTVYQFDLCSVIPCGSHPASWNGYDVYLCDNLQGSPGRVTGNGVNLCGNEGWCSRWGNVLWMTGRDAGRYVINRTRETHTKPPMTWAGKTAAFQRGGHFMGSNRNLVLTLSNITTFPYTDNQRRMCGPGQSAVYLVLGVLHSGTDTKALVKVKFLKPPTTPAITKPTGTPEASTRGTALDTREGVVNVYSLDEIDTVESIGIETGTRGEGNMWLQWIVSTARMNGMEDCVACAKARASLIPAPIRMNPTTNRRDFDCVYGLFLAPEGDGNCTLVRSLFPPGLNESTAPVFTMAGSNFTCLLREGNGTRVGVIEGARCQTTTNVTSWANATQLRHGAQDLYWLCGRRALLRLPRNWRGTCALMRFVIPVTLIGTRE